MGKQTTKDMPDNNLFTAYGCAARITQISARSLKKSVGLIKMLTVLIVVMVPVKLSAQTISGSTSVTAGESNEYSITYSGARLSWDAGTNGTIHRTWFSDGKSYCEASWSSPGNVSLDFRQSGTVITSLSVSVSAPTLYPGSISGADSFCSSGNPGTISNDESASGGLGTRIYQWQHKTSKASYSNISGATSATYNPPTISNTTTYRRRVEDDHSTKYTNEVTITVYHLLGGSISGNQTICYDGNPSQMGNTQGAAGGDGSYAYQWEKSTDNSTWTSISGATSSTYDPGSLTKTTYYRRKASSAECTAYSNTVTKTVRAQLSAGSISGVQTICYGTDAGNLSNSTSPSGGTGSYTYQWQISTNNSSWSDISGATSSSYDPTQTLHSDRWYRRMVTSGDCGTGYSSSVKVTVASDFSAGSISNDQTICFNSDPSIISNETLASGGVGSITYQWQESIDNSTWSSISGATAQSFDPPALTQTTYYRRKAISASCADKHSNTVTITVLGKLGRGAITGDQTICYEGDPDIISNDQSPTGGDGSYNYSWQYSTNNVDWTDIEGVTSNWYNPPGGLTRTTYFRRGVQSGSCTRRFTDPVTITVRSELTAGSISGAQTICYGTDAGNLSNSTSPSGGTGSYTYQWQISTNNSSWSDISGATFSSYDPTQTLHSDRWYRRMVTSGDCGTGYSSSVKVTVAPDFSAGSITNDQTICFNTDPSVISSQGLASGGIGSITYQWQESTDNSTWDNVSGGTGESFDPPVLTQTTYYRRKAISASCGNKNSNTVTITVLDKVGRGTITGDQTICYNGDPDIIMNDLLPSGGTGSYDYSWQYSTNNVDWVDIEGVTSNWFNPGGGLTGTTYYRRGVKSGDCDIRYTDPVTITVLDPLQPGAIQEDQEICFGTDAGLIEEMSPPSGGTGNYTFEWQKSTNGIDYETLDGETSRDMDPAANLYVDHWYRRVEKNGECGAVYSDPIKVTVADELQSGAIGSDQSICFGDTPETLENLTSAEGGLGALSYQWQSSPDGVSYEDIDGATDAAYQSGQLYFNTYFQRAAMVSGGCEPQTTSPILITVAGKINAGTIDEDQSIPWNTIPEALTGTEATGGEGDPVYQWQESVDGSTWINIDGAEGRHYYFDTGLKSSRYYRRTVTTEVCSPLTVRATNTILIDVESIVLTISSPMPGEEYDHGTALEVAWTANSPNVDPSSLTLVKAYEGSLDGGYEADLAEPIISPSHPLTAALAPDGDYQVLVEVEELSFLSDPFTIKDPVVHPLAQPIEGRQLAPGQRSDVLWSNIYDQAYDYDIHLEPEAGGSQVSIATNLGVDASQTEHKFSWKVPPVDPGIYTLVVKEVHGWIWFETDIEILPAKNNVRTYVAREPIVGSLAELEDPNLVQEAVTFFDGLGRPIQTVGVGASNTPSVDIVSYNVYDEYGRQPKQFLPHSATSQHGGYHDFAAADQQSYYELRFPGEGTHAYAEQKFEPSPFNRVVSQAAPGTVWAMDSGHTVDSDYDINSESDNVRVLHHDRLLGMIADDGVYATGQLTKVTIKDENEGAKEGETIEYTNKAGQVVLKQVKLLEEGGVKSFGKTYYIYDDFGNLRHVIQPEGIRKIEAGEDDLDWSSVNIEAFQKKWMFSYKYDQRQRMVAKRVPGSDWVYMVYDNRDRLVLTQDGNNRGELVLPENQELVQTTLQVPVYDDVNYYIQHPGSVELLPGFEVDANTATGGIFEAEIETEETRLENTGKKWQFTKYDALNRPVMTGFAEIETGNMDIEDHIQGFYDEDGSTFTESYTGDGPLQGYTNDSYPANITTDDLLTLTFYDNYDFTNEPLPAGAVPVVKGQVTGTKTRNLETNEWLTTITFYDSRYRVMETIVENHMGGRDEISSEYRNAISGLVRETKREHTGQHEVTVTDVFTYDHMDRLLTQTQTIEGEGPKVIAENTYNELGELIEKNVGGDLQSIDYTYNIRGWLKTLNGGWESFDDPSDKFGMELHYTDTDSTYQAFNGNIGRMSWRSLGGSVPGRQKYLYKYDAASRIKNAYYYNIDDGSQNNMYQVAGLVVDGEDQGITYDANGNIQALRRRGPDPETGNRVYLDDLRYAYDGNRLDNVDDRRGSGLFDEQYADGANTGEYQYDHNGNMILDANKGLEVTYNHLNLPEMVTFTHEPGKYVRYTYDAAGIKLRKESVSDDGSEVTDYVGGIQYKNGNLDFLQHAEGRAVYDGSNFLYEYNLTDHLGNVRVVVAEPETITMLATMETENADYDEAVFTNIVETRTPDGAANHTPGGDEVARVNNINPVGPFIALSVAPGDEIDLSVFAYFEPNADAGDPLPVETLASALAASVDPANLGLEGGNPLQSQFAQDLGSGAIVGDEDATIPRGYLNYLLYDDDLNLLQGGFVQISSAAAGSLEELSIADIAVEEVGYLMAYVSNESDIASFVSFDDFRVTHTTSGVKQVQDYYPFGLTFNEWTRAPENLYKYNGFEQQKETGWFDYLARQYDPALGRFTSVDPAADLMRRHSPYNYAFDNPIRYIDPDGMMADDVVEGDDGCENGDCPDQQENQQSQQSQEPASEDKSIADELDESIDNVTTFLSSYRAFKKAQREQENRDKKNERQSIGIVLTTNNPNGIDELMVADRILHQSDATFLQDMVDMVNGVSKELPAEATTMNDLGAILLTNTDFHRTDGIPDVEMGSLPDGPAAAVPTETIESFGGSYYEGKGMTWGIYRQTNYRLPNGTDSLGTEEFLPDRRP